MQLEAVGFQ